MRDVCSSLLEDSTSLSSQYMYVLLNCHRAEDFSWMKVWTRVNSSFYCWLWFLCRYNKCVIEFEVSIIICDLHSFLLWISCKFRINFVLIRELILVLVVSLLHESLQMILVSFLSLWLPICPSVCCCLIYRCVEIRSGLFRTFDMIRFWTICWIFYHCNTFVIM